MKAINIRLFIAAAAAFVLNACVEEKIQPAAGDRDDCMGVYFVEDQANAKTHTLEMEVDKTSLDFIVRRVNASEAAEIPYEYSVYKIVKTANSDTTYVEEPVEDYKSLLEPFGIDANDPDFWANGLSVITEYIDEIERLAKSEGLL